MNIVITRNEQHDCCEITVGDWVIVATGTEWEDGIDKLIIDIYNQDIVTTLYELLGFEMHTQQQGQSEVYFKGMRVVTETMEDTCGGPLSEDTVLLVATTRQPLGLLTQDYDL